MGCPFGTLVVLPNTSPLLLSRSISGSTRMPKRMATSTKVVLSSVALWGRTDQQKCV
jgi:hypothetical protein